MKAPKNNVLHFPETLGFRPYARYFCEESVQHPAKANLFMLHFLIEAFTKLGDTILDPMGGTGTTGVVANLLGRNAILVDLEEKFCGWMRKNIELTQGNGAKGKSVVIQGDSRGLTRILREKVESVIFSSPYSHIALFDERDYLPNRKGYSEITKRMFNLVPYSIDPSNIGNLPHGNIDAIITSPPYSEAEIWISERLRRDRFKGRRIFRDSNDPRPHSGGQIGDLPHGDIDAVITSPPYEATTRMHACIYHHAGYSPDKRNVGNLSGETYLSAMLKVYRECWKVLKNGGKLIVIVKNFVRNKKIVKLDEDTIKLCEAAGFRLTEHYYRKLKQKSFWRIVYHKKYPYVPTIDYEHILVFQKATLSREQEEPKLRSIMWT